MRKDPWPAALEGGADPKRAAHYLQQLRGTSAGAVLRRVTSEAATALTALLSGSQACGEWLVAHPEWLGPLLKSDELRVARGAPAYRRAVNAWLGLLLRGHGYAEALTRVRQFKQQETVRIALRDLARLSHAAETMQELSDLADVCLEAVCQVCREQLEQRFGAPFHAEASGRWVPTAFCVLGLGKLGGQELNYSSDVDVLFVYSEEGHTFREPPAGPEPTGRGLSNHQFFRRLAEALVGEVGRLAPEGMLYRIDLRLRPEGAAGPLVRSLDSYENYYWQYGQTWERLMLIKARRVAGDAALAGEFLEMVQAFRYPRSLSPQACEEIGAMKQRLETEVVRAGELDRNIKLGRGGIREIEFIVQTQQVLRAGKHPFLAHPQTLVALDKLAQYHVLPAAQANLLQEAYTALRDVEHRLQMDNNLQTHTIPTERQARERLARLMAFPSLKEFEAALLRHRQAVRRIYEQWFPPAAGETAVRFLPFDAHETEWKQRLAQRSFREPDQALRLCRAFVHGPGFGLVPARTEKCAARMLERLLELCPRREAAADGAAAAVRAALCPDGDPASRTLSDPDRVMARLDTFIAAYGSRALLFETWAAKPSLFDLLVLLFDRSEFLAETAIRTPDLVDTLEESGYLLRSKSAEQTFKDLHHGRDDEDQRRWLRRYHQTELMRIGLRDILGLADAEQNLVELSALADACLQHALDVAWRPHGPGRPPLAIIGLGKLGGAELNYGSDLDVVFVADNEVPDLPGLQRVAATVIELISGQTELGATFKLDARLRPDGEKGLLVSPLAACEHYYRQRAQLWEIQALSRARPIAGDPALGARLLQATALWCDFRHPATAAAAARQSGWMHEIARMRLRIEKERTPAGKESLALKTGAGGVMDAEFVAQALCLQHGWHEPNTLRALERAREAAVIPRAEAELLIENYRRLRRVESILRRWSYEGETELPDDPAPLYRVAVRCGFTQAEDFLRAVTRYRQNIRRVFNLVLGSNPC
jgi:glutamate-ammonia-ligase adenylyltransferase